MGRFHGAAEARTGISCATSRRRSSVQGATCGSSSAVAMQFTVTPVDASSAASTREKVMSPPLAAA